MFELIAPFQPSGDQPQAIEKLVAGINAGKKYQTLMGVTGSGKTFTMANVIQQLQRPTLVLSHNKTLAAQLYSEFREFFPKSAVSYFVSYYDYYQPEAYIPQRDIYIEKDASINEEIDRLRLAATSALVSRRDVIIVASVSCIYGLGSPKDYMEMMLHLQVGKTIERDQMLARLIEIQYDRNDIAFERGQFRVRGDCVEVFPSYEEFAIRVEFWGDEIEQLSIINPLTGETIQRLNEFYVYPAKHFVMPEERIAEAIKRIDTEMQERVKFFRDRGLILEAQRLSARTRYDMEMLQEMGYCSGIENYSAQLADRNPGSPPDTLYSFFPDDFLLFVDESHVTIPQIRAMYAGDQARKKNLVDHGFRLPSALDNRPLQFDEWEARLNKVVFVSATPNVYELERSNKETVEQVIRPTGLLDPVVEVSPASKQVPHLLEEIRARTKAGERVLVTTLTKKLAEDLAEYLSKQRVRCKWLHSELDAFERVELLRDLREGRFDVLVGVNLLREGLDLPEVSFVAILDADKEGFLRSETSLIQTIGRSARNVNAKVILYADKVTESMNRAINETNRRRAIQEAYNREHGITPETIRKNIRHGIEAEAAAHAKANAAVGKIDDDEVITMEYLNELEREMLEAAERLEFERAATLRDRIEEMRKNLGKKVGIINFDKITPKGRKRGKKQPSLPPSETMANTVPRPEKARGVRKTAGVDKTSDASKPAGVSKTSAANKPRGGRDNRGLPKPER